MSEETLSWIFPLILIYSSNNFSSSSNKLPNTSNASLIGCAVLISTPAFFNRLTGSSEQPLDKKLR